ncbi:hypothetical protein [Streptomyces sp. SID5910]|uniref:hypothetical protein n=1 Tax=Streptomyces sp. SID5910 TaxID=2690312 RepID=UPI001F2F4CDE|nr:hypothetical protein [Streptomyces sp. SID5910]
MTFDVRFSTFVLTFVRQLLDVDRHHGIDPEALEYLEPEDLEGSESGDAVSVLVSVSSSG